MTKLIQHPPYVGSEIKVRRLNFWLGQTRSAIRCIVLLLLCHVFRVNLFKRNFWSAHLHRAAFELRTNFWLISHQRRRAAPPSLLYKFVPKFGLVQNSSSVFMLNISTFFRQIPHKVGKTYICLNMAIRCI